MKAIFSKHQELADVISRERHVVRLSEVCAINPGKPKADALPSDALVSFVPMPAVSEVSGSIVYSEDRPFASVRGSYTAFREGDVIFAKITPCMENGKAAIAQGLTNGLGFGSSEFHVIRPGPHILPEFIHLLVRQECFRGEAKNVMTGSVGQARVPVDFLKNYEIELPPLDKQREIVAKIEELVEQVNSARERLAAIPILLKRFRQSVLAAAYSGDILGANADQPPRETFLGELIMRIEAGKSFKSEGFRAGEHKPGVIKVSAMTWGEFDEKENKQLLDGTSPHPKTEVRVGDLLFSRANTEELVGVTVLVKATRPKLYLSDKSLRLVTRPDTDKQWLQYALSSPIVRAHFSEVATGTSNSMRNISQAKLLQVPIILPLPAVQKEIVRRVESLFALADSIESRVAEATRQVERTTQAILAKAFRGELLWSTK